MAVAPCMFEIQDDLDISHRCIDESEIFFAQVIGQIEDIIMDEKFQKIHKQFMDENYQNFDDNDENKLIYTEIYKKYVETIEKYIESELIASIPGFSMILFEIELQKRENELDGEVFEILSTFSDFVLFKENFLDYKKMKEGGIDFSSDFSVINYTTHES